MRDLLAGINRDVPELKAQIQAATSLGERWRIYGILALRSIVIVAFAIALVGAFAIPFGYDNAIVGVVVLLSLLSFKKVHLGYDIRHSSLALFGIYAVLAAGPPAAYHSGPIGGFFVNIVALLFILIFGCDRVEFYNHAILVLSYLLLYGNPPADAHSATLRVIALVLGGGWAASLLYRSHADHKTGRGFRAVLRSFDPFSRHGVWKIQLATSVPLGMLIGTRMGLERTMWIGIATMSVLTPTVDTRHTKAIQRVIGTIIGCILFSAIIAVLPNDYIAALGIIGGICIGFSATYTYQSMFNSLGALGMAMVLYGAHISVVDRLVDNAVGIILALLATLVVDLALARLARWVRARRHLRPAPEN